MLFCEVYAKIKRYNFVETSDENCIVLYKNKRNLICFTKDGKRRIKYSSICNFYSTYEAKSNLNCLELLKHIDLNVINLKDGYVITTDNMTPFENFIDDLERVKI